MRIPTWRFLLIGGAVAVLAVGGIGLAAGAAAPATPSVNLPAAEGTRAPDATRDPDRAGPDGPIARERLERARLRGGHWLRLARHLVHAEVTVTSRDGELIVLAFDHGTVQAVDADSVTIAEAGGGTETVALDNETKVHVGRADGALDDLTVGDEVFVHSRVEGGSLAKRILILPEAAT